MYYDLNRRERVGYHKNKNQYFQFTVKYFSIFAALL